MAWLTSKRQPPVSEITVAVATPAMPPLIAPTQTRAPRGIRRQFVEYRLYGARACRISSSMWLVAAHRNAQPVIGYQDKPMGACSKVSRCHAHTAADDSNRGIAYSGFVRRLRMSGLS